MSPLLCRCHANLAAALCRRSLLLLDGVILNNQDEDQEEVEDDVHENAKVKMNAVPILEDKSTPAGSTAPGRRQRQRPTRYFYTWPGPQIAAW